MESVGRREAGMMAAQVSNFQTVIGAVPTTPCVNTSDYYSYLPRLISPYFRPKGCFGGLLEFSLPQTSDLAGRLGHVIDYVRVPVPGGRYLGLMYSDLSIQDLI